MRYTEEQYNQKYRALSPKIQSAIDGENIDESIADIAEKYKIVLEKRRGLGAEIGYVLVGLEQKNKLSDNLVQYAGLDDATARNIATEVEKEIFTPAEDSNLPAMPKAEQDVVIKKIFSNNQILNQQLEGVVPTPKGVPPPNLPIAPQPPIMNKPIGPSIIEARLGGSFNMPKEETSLKPKVDPYREPIE